MLLRQKHSAPYDIRNTQYAIRNTIYETRDWLCFFKWTISHKGTKAQRHKVSLRIRHSLFSIGYSRASYLSPFPLFLLSPVFCVLLSAFFSILNSKLYILHYHFVFYISYKVRKRLSSEILDYWEFVLDSGS